MKLKAQSQREVAALRVLLSMGVRTSRPRLYTDHHSHLSVGEVWVRNVCILFFLPTKRSLKGEK